MQQIHALDCLIAETRLLSVSYAALPHSWWLSLRRWCRWYRWAALTANERAGEIQNKCLVPIYVFTEIKLRASLFPKQNYNVLSPNFTFMYLWAINIFPGSVCLFCCSQIGRPILGIYKSLTETWMKELGRRLCSFISVGIHKSDFRYSAYRHCWLLGGANSLLHIASVCECVMV